MSMLRPLIARTAEGASLSAGEARAAFDAIMRGEASAAEIASLLTSLKMRGETADELSGAVAAMRAAMRRVDVAGDVVDTCGTGGDGHGTYNVSTAAAFVVAACGVKVAKHGNRSASSLSGSADVLKGLGVNFECGPKGVARCIAEAGIGFMFAPLYHPAMKHVAPVRSELGFRTIFNMIGPLSNPAGAKRQVVGVPAPRWLEPMADALKALGTTHAWVVHGEDGLDELTTTGTTRVLEVRDGRINAFDVHPEDAGLPRATLAALKGGDPAHNTAALQGVLAGAKNAYRDIVVLNAAAALVVGGRAKSLRAGADMGSAALDSGRAQTVLERLIDVSNRTDHGDDS